MTRSRIKHDRSNEQYVIPAMHRDGRDIPEIRYNYAAEEASIEDSRCFDFKRFGVEEELSQYVAEAPDDAETAARIVEADRIRTLRNHRMERAKA